MHHRHSVHLDPNPSVYHTDNVDVSASKGNKLDCCDAGNWTSLVENEEHFISIIMNNSQTWNMD